jgi:hypothetical protein
MTTPTLSPDEVDRRLRALPRSFALNAVDSHALDSLHTFRVDTARPKRPRPIRLAIGLTMAVLLIAAGNLAAAYYAPTYGQALAAAPVLRGVADPLLHAFGLTEQNAVALNSTATSSGHTIHLVAGYADGLRTVILLALDGRGLTGNPKQYGSHPGDYGIALGYSLTDQFGHSYKPNGGTGPTELQFEPLVWPASKVGARLTLHVTGLDEEWLLGTNARRDTILAGDWILKATLMLAGVHDLPLPAPVRTADGTFTVTLVRLTGSELQIRWTVSGPINDRFDGLLYSTAGSNNQNPEVRRLSQSYFSARFFDPAGQPAYGIDSGGEWDKGKPFKGTLNLTITHPGRYRLQLADVLSSADSQRWITVP